MLDRENSIRIAYISKTRGLKGEVQLVIQNGAALQLDLDIVFLELYGKLVPFFVSSYQILNEQTGYVCFEDVDSLQKATELIGAGVYVDRSALPEKSEEDFHLSDFQGFKVISDELGPLGVILEVKELPQQYIAVLEYKSKELMFPLNEDFIEKIDWDEQTLYVSLPKGLLDVYLS